MSAPWAPMAAPPLPARNDPEFNTCEHAYPAESCTGREWHQLADGMIAGPIIDPRTGSRLVHIVVAP